MTHHTGFDARQSPSSLHVTARPLTAASGEDEFIVPEQHLKRRTGSSSSAKRRPSPPSIATTATPTPTASTAAGKTSYRRYRNLGGLGGGQRSSVRRRRKPVSGRQR